MSKLITAQGTYSHPETKEDIVYSFEYTVIDSVADAIDNIGEDKVKSLVQRMLKLDANNVAREKAKSENGHSSRKPLTEEQKAEAKAERNANKEILALLKSKGITAEQLAKM